MVDGVTDLGDMPNVDLPHPSVVYEKDDLPHSADGNSLEGEHS